MTNQHENETDEHGIISAAVAERDDEFSTIDDTEQNVSPNSYDVDNESAREFLARGRIEGLRESTVVTYESSLRHFVDYNEYAKETTPRNTTKDDVQQFYLHCIRDRNNGQSTLKKKSSTISNFYDYLEVHSDINPNISGATFKNALSSRILSMARDPIEREALSRDEITKMYNNSDKPRNELMLRYLYETGGRNSDIVGLKINNVDLENLVVEFIDSKGGKDYEVPIRKDLALRTDNWIKSGRQTYRGWPDHDYLFPSSSGGKLNRDSLTKIVRKTARDAGIQEVLGKISDGSDGMKKFHRVTPHAFRHSILTHLDDLPDSHRQLLSGHENRKTLESYTHKDNQSVFDIIRDEIH